MRTILEADQITAQMQRDPAAYVAACEAAFQAQIDNAAQRILAEPNRRIIMLAGPSSSGKTTAAEKLRHSFAAQGRRAWKVSLDDFYREPDTPMLFEDGTPDYETVYALDLPYLKQCLQQLLSEKRCFLPHFSFSKKQRINDATELVLEPGDLVIVEGLHALNPLLTNQLDANDLFQIYISVSTRVTQENDVLLSTHDLRFLRRMIRDVQFRASPVENTFYLWNGVQKGEDRYLFPYRDRADLRIDSLHAYEPCAFRDRAIALLQGVPQDSVYFERANLLQNKLSMFPSLDENLIPQPSLLHEFLG